MRNSECSINVSSFSPFSTLIILTSQMSYLLSQGEHFKQPKGLKMKVKNTSPSFPNLTSKSQI